MRISNQPDNRSLVHLPTPCFFSSVFCCRTCPKEMQASSMPSPKRNTRIEYLPWRTWQSAPRNGCRDENRVRRLGGGGRGRLTRPFVRRALLVWSSRLETSEAGHNLTPSRLSLSSRPRRARVSARPRALASPLGHPSRGKELRIS